MQRDLKALQAVHHEVTQVHHLVRDLDSDPQGKPEMLETLASLFNPALFDKAFPALQGSDRCLNSMQQMCQKCHYLTGWRWVRYPDGISHTKADDWFSSWTDLSHEDCTDAMHSVNAIFASQDVTH